MFAAKFSAPNVSIPMVSILGGTDKSIVTVNVDADTIVGGKE